MRRADGYNAFPHYRGVGLSGKEGIVTNGRRNGCDKWEAECRLEPAISNLRVPKKDPVPSDALVKGANHRVLLCGR